ncbi:pyridoxamine 5'-phosphate oxidase family protein [Pseudonocardia yunnanensis]|uniref:Pyridoxamine 5'-phosphate oxidase family protein n=1 Tax=Pseudonocardia yunnanensis TaxID=58107 RepID=A0ABW4ETI7_9PSEU
MPLTIEERQQFLAEPHIAALSVAGGAERAPLTVPMWYQYTPGGEAWVLTGVASTKAKLIQAAGRFTLMVDRVDPTLRYVTVEGSVTRTEPGTDEHLLEMSRRYLPAEAVPGYVEVAKAEHGEQMVIYLRPERWLSADLGRVS